MAFLTRGLGPEDLHKNYRRAKRPATSEPKPIRPRSGKIVEVWGNWPLAVAGSFDAEPWLAGFEFEVAELEESRPAGALWAESLGVSFRLAGTLFEF
jgi:hypothetical protein